jgi:hypothetical protein
MDTPSTRTHTDAHWDGTVEIDPETGDVSGTGTGFMTGNGGGNEGCRGVSADIAGSWQVTFAGESTSDKIDLAVKGIRPAVTITGNLKGCSFLRPALIALYKSIASNPGLLFDVDRFSFVKGDTASRTTSCCSAPTSVKITIESTAIH